MIKIIKKAEYKSAIRSRQMIREAFVSLLSEKSPEKITVTDIVKKADINRGTFYAHYKSPHDVIAQIAQEIVDEITGLFKGFQFSAFLENPYPTFEKFSNYLEQNKEMYAKLVSMQGVSVFLQKIKQMLFDFITSDKTVPKKFKKSEYFETSVDFFINAIVYSFKDQLEGKVKTSTDNAIKVMSFFISQNAQYIKQNPK